MNSDYLDRTRSLEELDALFERDRVAAAEAAETLYRLEVATAITSIGEINQVAGARILADSQVASAKMLTDAEVSATGLAAEARIAALELQKLADDKTLKPEVRQAMIVEIGHNVASSLSDNAKHAIQQMHLEAHAAIGQIRHSATKAVAEIQARAQGIAAEIAASADKARAALAAEKSQPRSPEGVVEHAEAAAHKILEHAAQVSHQLTAATDQGIAGLNALADEAAEVIAAAVVNSERRVNEARDRAVALIRNIALAEGRGR